MGLAVAIQMDPIDTINIDADSTFALALEAQARGHALYHYLPQALTLRDGRLYARGRPLEVFRRQGNHHRFGAAATPDDGTMASVGPCGDYHSLQLPGRRLVLEQRPCRRLR